MELTVSDLPTLNATLNGTSAVLLTIGYYFIRQRNRTAHKAFMLAAFVSSTLFLISYVIYHWNVGSVPFQGPAWARPIYYTILLSHVLLAAVILPLALLTLFWALRNRLGRHRRIARWTLPLWLYVSVTGVVVYLMLYRLFPASG